MSLVATRVAMTHRCSIERDVNQGSDDGWGNPRSPDWKPHLADVPCRTAGPNVGREAVTDERTVVVVDQRLLLPLDTDVTERDRLGNVTNRGTVILRGPIGIEAVLRRATHIELMLTGIR